ncbi:hypothetical protein EMIT093MI4_490002 [Pseudomonas sp. IT-93MI4]
MIDGFAELLDLGLQVANMVLDRLYNRRQLGLLESTLVVVALLDEVLA